MGKGPLQVRDTGQCFISAFCQNKWSEMLLDRWAIMLGRSLDAILSEYVLPHTARLAEAVEHVSNASHGASLPNGFKP